VHGSKASGKLGIEGLVFTGISFAYFGAKRKEEAEREMDDAEALRAQRFAEKRKI
jgi:hypothetical protein